MSEHSAAVAVPRTWLLAPPLLGAVLGGGAALVIGPVVGWLLGLIGDAPGPLRLAALLPVQWALPALIVVGLAAGAWVAGQWRKEYGTIEIGEGGVTVHRPGANVRVPRERIAGIYIDRSELVLHDDATDEMLRIRTEGLLAGRLRAAAEQFDLPWLGTTNPLDGDFTTWVDGDSWLDEAEHMLLRERARALTDKQSGSAERAREELRACGLAVRDREEGQQYRITGRRSHA